MKIITLHQPYASLVALGLKRYETRHWRTDYRGPLLIHGAKTKPKQEYLDLFDRYSAGQIFGAYLNPRYALGKILALVDLTDCIEMNEGFIGKQDTREQSLGHWEPGRFAFRLENVRALYPTIAWKSRQGKLLDVPSEIKSKVCVLKVLKTQLKHKNEKH